MEEDKIDSNEPDLPDYVEVEFHLPPEMHEDLQRKLRDQLGREVEDGDVSDLVEKLLQGYLKG